jgi:hypothetical protein
MVSGYPQCAYNIFNSILLKQTDRCDTGRSGMHARGGVLHRDAAEGKDRNLRPAGFP